MYFRVATQRSWRDFLAPPSPPPRPFTFICVLRYYILEYSIFFFISIFVLNDFFFLLYRRSIFSSLVHTNYPYSWQQVIIRCTNFYGTITRCYPGAKVMDRVNLLPRLLDSSTIYTPGHCPCGNKQDILGQRPMSIHQLTVALGCAGQGISGMFPTGMTRKEMGMDRGNSEVLLLGKE